MKKLAIATMLLILITSSSYASGLTDPVVKSPVVSEQGENKGGGFKKFLFLLLLFGI
jgi:hypothetical protein|tara:strand:- start:244 stop:414 length:171 start_codon:yes stop_codon:yes gene_type:complete